jgi:hypothetical protein
LVTVVLTFLLVALLGASPARAQEDSTGAYRTETPIEVPSYHGLEPHLTLTYNSSSGNGFLGVGWNLSGLSRIERTSPGKGTPNYDSSDVYWLDGMELVPCQPGMQSPSCKDYPASPSYKPYTTKIESFQRIAYEPSDITSDRNRWHVWDKDGTERTYDVRDCCETSSRWTSAWYLSSVEDTLGNKVSYNYSRDSSSEDKRLDSITYNGTDIKFYYESRPDTVTRATGGLALSLRSIPFRLKTIDVMVGGERARAYKLSYETRDEITSRSMLSGVQEFGRDARFRGKHHRRYRIAANYPRRTRRR